MLDLHRDRLGFGLFELGVLFLDLESIRESCKPPYPMAASISSTVLQWLRRARFSMKVARCSSESTIILRRSSRSRALRPSSMFSSRRSFLNQLRILFLASLVLTMLSQSRLGPRFSGPVRISMISPVCTLWSMETMRLFTLAPTIRLPTAE